jgi:hypothetical protein
VVAFSCALRGEEVPLTDLAGILKHWDKSIIYEIPHITIAFSGECNNLLPIVFISNLDINNALWVGRLLDVYKGYGIVSGPMFRNSQGTRIKANEIEPVFFDQLEQVQNTHPDLIPSLDDVVEDYGIYISFHQGSTSKATNQGLPPEKIDANNCWRKFQRVGASRPTMAIRDHYSVICLTLKQSLRYSACL